MLVLLCVSGSVLLTLILGGLLRDKLSRPDLQFTGQVVGLVCGQGLGLVWIWRFLREHQVTWSEAFGFWRAPLRSSGLAFATMLVALPMIVVLTIKVVAPVMKVFGVEPEPQVTVAFVKQQPMSWQIAVLGFLALVLVPIGEEMFFRGVLYTTIKQRGYPRMAFWGTAALFAVIHFNLAGLLPLFFLAVVFTWLYERTGNLLAPITAHFAFNAINFVALLPKNVPQWLEKLVNQ